MGQRRGRGLWDSPQSVTQSKMCLFSRFEAGAGYRLSAQLAFVFYCGICELSFVRKAQPLPPQPWVGIGWSAFGSHDRTQAESWWFSSVRTRECVYSDTVRGLVTKKWPTLVESRKHQYHQQHQQSQCHAVSGTISEWTPHGQWIMSVHHGVLVFVRSKHCCIHGSLRVCQMNW